jgi:hypothetical protein
MSASLGASSQATEMIRLLDVQRNSRRLGCAATRCSYCDGVVSRWRSQIYLAAPAVLAGTRSKSQAHESEHNQSQQRIPGPSLLTRSQQENAGHQSRARSKPSGPIRTIVWSEGAIQASSGRNLNGCRRARGRRVECHRKWEYEASRRVVYRGMRHSAGKTDVTCKVPKILLPTRKIAEISAEISAVAEASHVCYRAERHYVNKFAGLRVMLPHSNLSSIPDPNCCFVSL